MLKEAILDDRNGHSSPASEEVPIAPDLIREELQRIVASRHFRTSRRGKEFLQYVVDEKINGHGDLLKERLIGVQLFGRKPDYATGEDPVVRVQAGDVRRRLESYHADPEIQADILIQIPVGSYAPVFLYRKSIPHYEPWPSPETTHAEAEGVDEAPSGTMEHLSAAAESLPHGQNDHPPVVPVASAPQHAGWRDRRWRLAIPAAACLALVAWLTFSYLRHSPDSTLKTFWQPASLSARPVLICLPKPIVYRPSEKLYDQYAAKHPEAFATRESRRDQILPMAPTDTVQWSDMVPVRSSGPGIGAVVAAVNIGKLLTEQGIRFELRFGEEATYADMRDSPVVIVGAINTEWASELTSESNFVFDESRDAPKILETAGSRRVWKMESRDGNITRDYGLITRQLSGKAGQFLVQVAGISHFGTEAASEFLANKKELTGALHSKPINLQKQNFQIVVSTDITAGRAGPPHVVAIGSW
ncbi:hypothetical protein SAMN05421770_11421 [Granulicella rosea]|uniref:Uncharacterized protein n=1 Tax=Granulicella rosea TaxID=474952 RepID=A0A239MJB7_9BACT|nr:hypothetical protein [Granulicella rosea]SNT42731.1 hypothetical protein SAMN05421770_11421 [Granulicella rosea]